MLANRHTAPGRLELVRRLLNTWVIANETHLPEDRLPFLLKDSGAFKEIFGVSPPRSSVARFELAQLRDDLRALLAPAPLEEAVFTRWLAPIPLAPRVTASGVVHEPLAHSVAGMVLAAAVDAVALGQWPRLKACADCQWVYFDHTRNGSRRWCGMYAEGPEGRSCGSIAKVRRYRQRQRQRPRV